MHFKRQSIAAGSSLLAAGLLLTTGCTTPGTSATQRDRLLLTLEREMATNSGWVRIHAAEALIDHGRAQKVVLSFSGEADTAAPPYRIGVWRVLARSADTEEQRQAFTERIRRTMLDPQAPDRIHAAESLAKLGAARLADRPALVEWLATLDEPASVYPLWLLVLSGDSSGPASSEARLSALLDSSDSTARLRAAFALGRIKAISPVLPRALEPAAGRGAGGFAGTGLSLRCRAAAHFKGLARLSAAQACPGWLPGPRPARRATGGGGRPGSARNNARPANPCPPAAQHRG